MRGVRDIGGGLVGNNPGGVADLPQVVVRCGEAQRSQAGLSRASFSGRKSPALGNSLTQASEEDLVSEIPAMDMAHEPLDFVSGEFEGS